MFFSKSKPFIKIGAHDYQVNYEDRLGEGGFGSVYSAQRKGSEKSYVVKIVDRKYEDEDEEENGQTELLETEVDISQQYYDCEGPFYDETEEKFFIAMEYLPGKPILPEYVTDLEFLERIQIIQQLAHMVHWFHCETPKTDSIIHRDIKGDNVHFSKNEKGVFATIFDFGVSLETAVLTAKQKRVANSKKETYRIQEKIGTLGYMAPEIRDRMISPDSDVYSLFPVILILLGSDLKKVTEYEVGAEGFPSEHDDSESSIELSDLSISAIKEAWNVKLQNGDPKFSLPPIVIGDRDVSNEVEKLLVDCLYGMVVDLDDRLSSYDVLCFFITFGNLIHCQTHEDKSIDALDFEEIKECYKAKLELISAGLWSYPAGIKWVQIKGDFKPLSVLLSDYFPFLDLSLPDRINDLIETIERLTSEEKSIDTYFIDLLSSNELAAYFNSLSYDEQEAMHHFSNDDYLDPSLAEKMKTALSSMEKGEFEVSHQQGQIAEEPGDSYKGPLQKEASVTKITGLGKES